MKKQAAVMMMVLGILLSGCQGNQDLSAGTNGEATAISQAVDEAVKKEAVITLGTEIVQLEEGFSAVRFAGDYGFAAFLAQGGATSDEAVAAFLADHFLAGMRLGFRDDFFGCSTIAAVTPSGNAVFGRNFDWNSCDAMVVAAQPEAGYASLSTVNMDFITQGVGDLPNDAVRTMAALYAPLDGMNAAGLAVSVNMIQDRASIEQNTDKPDLTTTTAVRLLLDRAASVDEAVALLREYDLHASMGMMVHFALADASGRSVVVEYVHNEMVVTETPVVTNFYLAAGEKNGLGTRQSHERYDILLKHLADHEHMSIEQVRDALDSVSKDNFGEFESTEWSVVFDLTNGTARYYHRENYDRPYIFALGLEG